MYKSSEVHLFSLKIIPLLTEFLLTRKDVLPMTYTQASKTLEAFASKFPDETIEAVRKMLATVNELDAADISYLLTTIEKTNNETRPNSPSYPPACATRCRCVRVRLHTLHT